MVWLAMCFNRGCAVATYSFEDSGIQDYPLAGGITVEVAWQLFHTTRSCSGMYSGKNCLVGYHVELVLTAVFVWKIFFSL